ncbi:MAG: hypothetical protein APF77_03245 [Clostridia bacterium BRH_c25]|nr:MAG: hypothetical protein APF77_03245 [Clostridia bacterium BRH_c25]
MIEVIIITHGDLAKALKESAELIVGKQKHIQTFCLKHGDSVDELKENINQAVSLCLQEGNEVIALTDMFSGSPFNVTTANMNELGFIHITGINLPILIEILLMRQSAGIREISEAAVENGRNSIKLVNDLLRR